MAHEVARDARSVFPPAAPAEETLHVERAAGGVLDEALPIDGLGSGVLRRFLDVVGGVELPLGPGIGAVYVGAAQRHLAELPGLEDLARLGEIRIAILVMSQLQRDLVVAHGLTN